MVKTVREVLRGNSQRRWKGYFTHNHQQPLPMVPKYIVQCNSQFQVWRLVGEGVPYILYYGENGNNLGTISSLTRLWGSGEEKEGGGGRPMAKISTWICWSWSRSIWPASLTMCLKSVKETCLSFACSSHFSIFMWLNLQGKGFFLQKVCFMKPLQPSGLKERGKGAGRGGSVVTEGLTPIIALSSTGSSFFRIA